MNMDMLHETGIKTRHESLTRNQFQCQRVTCLIGLSGFSTFYGADKIRCKIQHFIDLNLFRFNCSGHVTFFACQKRG